MATKLAIECPSVTECVINILSRPLLQKLDHDFGRRQLVEHVCSDLPKPQEINEPPLGNERLISVLSTKTTSSDNSSSFGSATSFQGLLTCMWKDGMPNHVFTVDGKTDEAYVASLSRARPFNDDGHDKGPDYVYTFCSRRKEARSQIVGTMPVSTSIINSNKSSEIRETRFVLSLKDPTDEIHIDHKMSKSLKSKVVKAFRSAQSCKQRQDSIFSWSGHVLEDSLWNPSDSEDRAPNLELGAVIVRDVWKNRKEDEGGWGLKFLKKSGKDACVKTILPSERSTSLDVLIPAGPHGGPRTGDRLSSLVERWGSGGQCDCGGWDIGCPLSVLNVGPRGSNSSVVVDNFGECNSVDLFMQGLKQEVPTFKMANICDGLYYIQFQSSLSNLQSLAIAVAIIHSRSPVLRFDVPRA